jgi:hypothetical protein
LRFIVHGIGCKSNSVAFAREDADQALVTLRADSLMARQRWCPARAISNGHKKIPGMPGIFYCA